MTAERHVPQDDDETGFALALTLPLVARSDSPDSGRMPTDLATHLSTFDPEMASFAEPAVAAPRLARGSAVKPQR